MSFKNEKQRILSCITSGNVLHEQRGAIDEKNILVTGQVSIDTVASVIARAKGYEYEQTQHHRSKQLKVHIIKSRYSSLDWYIKWYFIEPNVVFISVHH